MGGDELARHTTVRELVAAFQDAAATVRRCFGEIVEAEERLNDVFTMGGNQPIRIEASRHSYSDNFGEADRCVDRMARQAWERIVERLEIRRMMSIKRWEELQKQLKDGELPAITEENVAAFAQGYLDAMPDMLADAVEEVFNWLRPERSEYKRNSELEVQRRVVLRWVVERNWSNSGFRANYARTQHLAALENVFGALAGNGSVSKTHQSALQNAIEASGSDGVGETDMFAFRVFRNGNMHLTFLRTDLLVRFNAIAGGRRLRPAKEVA